MNSIVAGDACLCRINKVEEVADLLGSLANEHRLVIVALLHDAGEMNVSALVDKLGVERTVLSRHLAKLREMDVVATRRHHNRVYYTLNHAKVGRILSTLGLFSGPSH